MKSVPRYLVAMAFLLAGCGGGPREPDLQRYPIIPLPAQLDARPGAFLLTPDTRIALEPTEDRELRSSVERWAQSVRAASGLPLTIVRPGEEPSGSLIRVLLEHAGEGASEPAPQERYPGTALEAYSLRVTPDEVTLEARGRAGIFYGLGTISQLMPAMSGSSDTELMARRVEAAGLRSPWSVPAAEIKDEPRFPYRGVHLDVGRHFFGVEFIKRYIDLMASYRMNVFHWHLTEDQGWRLEIERYPRLTEVGSCRAETELPPGPGLVRLRRGDGIAHCGFYTQEEAREIIEYAAERFITVIPAIEMPGHSTAALAAYPELACTDGPFEVSPRWGVHREILCPKEGTFTFLEGVLTEVMGIFPSRYVIVPGDEVPTIRWEESEVAQEVIRREGLGDEVQLKGWFTGRIQDFLERNGRYVLGGDDGRYGAVSPSAAVLASGHWAVDAARAGRDVIMISRSHLFLDHYQGDPLQEPPALRYYTPLEEVYGYEPVPMGLEPGEADRILGAQGMVWTELMPTPDHVEYMVLPRLLAVSEALWSPAEARQWQGFTSRLSSHLGRLDDQGYNLRIPDVLGLERDRLTLAPEMDIRLSAPMEGGAVLYTTDGSDPGPGDALLEQPLTLAVDEVGVEIAARIQLPDGRLGPTRRARFRRAALSDALVVADSVRRPGLTARFVSGYFPSVDRFLSSEDAAGVTEAVLGEAEWAVHTPTVSLPENLPSRSFVLILEGLIRVPDSGIYTFYLTSQDGGRVDIADHLVVDQASPHRDDDGQWNAGGMDTDAGEVALEAGWHPLRVTYLWGGGSPRLRLELEGPNLTRRVVPASWLAHRGPGGH
jgi:hexosaminidase